MPRATIPPRPRERRAAPTQRGAGRHEALIRALCERLEAETDGRITLRSLAQETGLSPTYVQRLFKRWTGVSPQQYAAARRLERLKAGLRGKENVTMAMYEAGYGSSSRLYERASTRLGMTPGTYRRLGAGVAIRYATARTPLGIVLVGATDRGICKVAIGDSERALLRDLREEFPRAGIRPDRDGLRGWVSAVARQAEGRVGGIELPLDIRATAFQWKVWCALRTIPPGDTRTYQEIARSIGSPRAARAVGRACATNPVAIVIPCHRAVRGDGTLGGYAYGVDRKERLLDAEARGGREGRGKPPGRPAGRRRPGNARSARGTR